MAAASSKTNFSEITVLT